MVGNPQTLKNSICSPAFPRNSVGIDALAAFGRARSSDRLAMRTLSEQSNAHETQSVSKRFYERGLCSRSFFLQ
jgi:hypothetical protein